jgi:glycosyltransferase involved in cell wall biosynthesis
MQAAKFQPDLVHVLEFQNGGYAYLRATKSSNAIGRAKLLLTPYGSDIYWYQNEPSHLDKIKRLLSLADGISSECRRDEILAKQYGFAGALMPRVPAFGAIKISVPESDRSNRKAIAVKGYQNKWGQALLALKALEQIAESLAGFEIVLYSCNAATLREAKGFARRTGLVVTAHGKGELSNSEVLDIFRRSVLYIGLSTSDGISASMIEAMANGAIPVQSDSSCCGEWLEDGLGGHLVKYHDVDRVSSLVSEILANQDWQRRAALANFDRLNLLLEPTATIRAAHETYELMAKI